MEQTEPWGLTNGKLLSSEDVKFSLERYTSPSSATASRWFWLDRVETPDLQTAVVRTKKPFADALRSMTPRAEATIASKDWEEGPERENKLMGTGPYLFVDDTPPVLTRFKRNPDYFLQPYPYFRAGRDRRQHGPRQKDR